MIPQPLEEGGYEGFGELTDRANSWLKDQSDILVTNMQSLTVQKNAGEPPASFSCFSLLPPSPCSSFFYVVLAVVCIYLNTYNAYIPQAKPCCNQQMA